MASFLTKLAEKVAAAAPVGGHAPRTSLSSLVAAVQRAAPVPASAGRAQARERGAALAEASPRAGGKSLESLTDAVVAVAAPRAPTKSLASLSAAVLAAVPASSTRPMQTAAPAARSLPDAVTPPRAVEKSLASITTAVVAATPSSPVPSSARAGASSVRAGTRIGFLGDTANGPSEGTVTSVDGAYFWGRLDNGRTLVRQPIALLSTPRWRVLPGASTPSVREPASAAAKSLVGVATTVEIAAAIQSVRAPASLKVDDLDNGWDTPPTQRAPVSATPVRAERASAVAPSKTHRKHLAHVVNDERRERHARELVGLADVLTQGGYDPADAARLQAEGMGPDELRERIKGLPGSLGSLQHTHGLRQRNAPAATSHVPDTTTVDEAWDEPIASPPPPRIDSIKALVALPIGTVLRLVRTPQGAMSSRRALIAADKNALRFRIADPTDRDHTKLVTQALTAATLVEPRPNGFALLLQDRAKRQPPSLVAEYAFDDAVDPLSVGTWRAALGRHELAETAAERATRVAQTGEWVEDARRLYQNATKPAAEATRLRDLEDAHAMHTATSLRELDPLRLERLVEATRASATYEALHALLVAAQERGAFGVPSAQFALFQREAAAIATELDRISKGRFDPIRERIRRAITMVRHAKGFGKKLKVATAALREALDARKTAHARHALAVTSTEHADSAVVEHRAEALSQRLDQKAPCATDEGVLAATLGAYKTTPQIATDLGCDVAAVGEVLARLVEQNKLRKTVAANKPERWGHDVPPWNEAWAVHRIGDRLYGDTAFLTASGQLPRFSVTHQGFGDFALETPKGEVHFNRGAGVDFPGQTGRSHLLEGKPEALALLFKEMHVDERWSEEAKAATTRNDVSDATDDSPPAPGLVEVLSPVEHRTAAARRDANIKAMWLAADLEAHPRPLSDEDRLILAAYSDWGGIGIQKSLDKFPPGFDIPDSRQLIHAYFTPPAICAEIARLVQPLLADLVATDGRVHALEPAVGIGRFPLALSGRGFESVTWHCVEFSKLSYKMLHALRPDIDLYQGPFEGWIASHAADFAGRLKLVISNPPYGQRSYATTDDPDRSYRYKRADHYFLRRGLDLLGTGGLGIYIIPSGFLTGTTEDAVELRATVLRSHHLAAAFRLPNEVFSLANVVTDILFFRARGGSLTEVDEADKFILEGRYYDELPAHILGTVVPNEPGKRGWHTSAEGYTVTGEFTALPAVLDERPICSACLHTPAPDTAPPPNAAPGTATKATAADQIIDTDERMGTVSALGHRVESFLASVANPDLEPVGWEELHHDLAQWATINGSPAQDKAVLALAKAERGPLGKGPPGGAGWLLKAFLGKSATLIASLAEKPSWTPRFLGNPKDALQVGEHLYRSRKTLTIGELPGKDPSALFAAGWCEDSTASAWVERVEVRGQLLPPDEYLFGELWPRFDRAQARAALGDAQAAAQAARLIEIIKPATFDEIEVTPQDGFVPIELLAAWLMTMNHRDPVELVREKGLVHLANVAYEDHDKSLTSLSTEALLILGWVNHDYVVFQPHAAEGEKVDDVRLALAKDWTQRFRAWLDSDSSRQRAIEYHYQRARQGYRAHGYGSEPLKLARWNPAIVLNPHQIAGARRIDANRGGGLGFDVGVGKTFTITASLALARQAGRARRAVIVVPQPIAFQWVANLAKSLPDFRVVVIGINKKTIAHGLRKGVETSETDSPEERSRKWARFQGGEFDVAILTYDALPRTQMDHESTVGFIEGVSAIEREVEIRRRNAIKHSKGALKKYEEEKGKLDRKLEKAEAAVELRRHWPHAKLKGDPVEIRAHLADLEKKHRGSLTERQDAVLTEGVGAWLAEMLELPASWKHDPDIVWNTIGVDWMAFDEGHNGKNLHMPSSREGGSVPKFMGNEGEGSKRAWHWFFRCCDVQSRGGEVIMATATPASNSPVEFYNLVKFMDKDAWSRVGIYDPEAFIDRFCLLEPQEVLNAEMEAETRLACVGFKNLDELRSVIFKFWEFKTAKQAKLKLPVAKVDRVFVNMDAAQEKKYESYIAEIENALSNPREGSHKILGLLAKMAMVAMHSQLDEKFGWKDAGLVSSPHSPKFDAVAQKILAQRGCGHIVFADYIAAHAWIRDVLIEAGIPAGRIGILNAVVAPAAADRQRIARDFNGDAQAGIASKYDVLIANAIGEEGVDLQDKTCAIHHMDIGWTPKKTEQRNGRGVRQGNTLSNINIFYYIANRSQDGTRLDMVRGKQNWISSLLEGEDKDTNNPAAQSTLSRKELLVLISRDPEKTRLRLEAAEAEREEERKKKVAKAASDTLRAVANRFDRARTERDPTIAAEYLSVAKQKLAGLAKVPPEIWPWAGWAVAAEQSPMLVPKDGGPVFEGLRVAMPRVLDHSVIEYAEFGRIDGATLGTRVAGAAHWETIGLDQVVQLHLEPQMRIAEGSGPSWPSDDKAGVDKAVEEKWLHRFRHGPGSADAWTALGWMRAPNRFVEQHWTRWGNEIVRAMASTGGWAADLQVPAIRGNQLVLGLTPPFSAVLPPTLAGWQRFLELAPMSGEKFTILESAGLWWFGRGIPRNLLVAEAAPRSVAA